MNKEISNLMTHSFVSFAVDIDRFITNSLRMTEREVPIIAVLCS